MHLLPWEIRQAWRRLASTPALSLGAVLILALGIGSVVVMGDVLDRLLLRPPAGVADPDRVARLYIRGGTGAFIEITGYDTFEAVAALHDEVEAAAAYFDESLSLGRGTTARQVQSVAASPDYFKVLGVRPALGALPAGSDTETAAVLSYGLWKQEFGGSSDAIGKRLQLGTDTYTIVAVAPADFHGVGSKPADVWLPLAVRGRASYGDLWRGEYAVYLHVIARQRDGVDRARTSERATAAFRATHTSSWQRTSTIVLGDLRTARAPGVAIGTRVETMIGGVTLLVLLLTCGNVANILLVRGLRRGRELAVKTALGASRARLRSEVMLEAAVLAAGAGLATLIVVVLGGALVRDVFLPPLAALASPLDGRVIAATVLLCLATTFLLGVIPALRVTSRDNLVATASAAGRPSRLLDVFSAAQIALSLPMVVGAGLFAVSLWQARSQDFGMTTDRVVVITANLFEVGRPGDTHAAHRAMQARLAGLPQVESTAVIENIPMRDTVMRVIGGKAAIVNGVDSSFFGVMGMRLTQGRLFTDNENHAGRAAVAVVTESMARQLEQGPPAVGKCLAISGFSDPCTEVVGVVADARLSQSIRPVPQTAAAVYVPLEQMQTVSRRALLVRTHGDPSALLALLRREAQSAAPDLPYVDAYAFDDVFANLLKPWRLGANVFMVFGVLSVAIAAVGLALVGAYGVTRRTREIGIRSALGAEPRQLVALLFTRAATVAVCGLGAGLALAWAGGRTISSQLFGVDAHDPRVLSAATCVVLLVGALAAWLPARRAARIEPTAALRVE